ncbi:hypothetical protein CB0940_06721 [Cercospora beticola]|uniref:Uncharacterized protein n=1 Tax=Cercospora beticola TaxID=122368 RepID=A0A2G5H8A1_CERBT|nr:hypothetical protein CB0940_06721 [Cercospora beticola]PIA88751.1 hypothetical protein CB0940_06721 [Cercospora beticola]WPB02621.1 hypothetical protein RHO25_007257 [Cercospora beticola]
MATDGGSEDEPEHDGSTDGEARSELTSSAGTDTLELRERLESLPQELYNHIYDFTFTATSRIRIFGISPWARFYLTTSVLPDTASRRVVTFDERLPSMLRVDRASRKKFADSYFGGEDSTFIFYVGYEMRDYDLRHYFEGIPDFRKLIKNVFWSSEAKHHVRSFMDSKVAGRFHEYWLEKSPESFKFLTYNEVEALVKKRAGIADEDESDISLRTTTLTGSNQAEHED